MKKILLTSILLCACVPNEAEYFEAKRNFTYKPEKVDAWNAYDYSKPFTGDCEDYAFTLQKEIGGEVWLVRLKNDYHAVLVKDGISYDFINRVPVMKKHYNGKFIKQIKLKEGI